MEGLHLQARDIIHQYEVRHDSWCALNVRSTDRRGAAVGRYWIKSWPVAVQQKLQLRQAVWDI